MDNAIKKIINDRFGDIKIYPDGFDVKQVQYTGPSGQVKPIVQDKPWGAEVWFIYTEKYGFKIMFFEPNKRFSLQTHEQKEESWYIMAGNPRILLGEETIIAEPGMVFHNKTGTLHRIGAGDEMAEVWEVSTSELWDVVHIEDDFGRK